MSGRRRAVLIAAGVALAVVAAVLAFRPASTGQSPGRAAPAFETVDLEGRPVRLADYRGRPVLLNFWASWCVPCRKEFPLFTTIDQQEVAVLGVVFKDTKEAAAAFMREQGASWPALEDEGSRIADAYDVGFRPGLPVTVLIDRDGGLVDRHVGELRQGDLDRLLALARA